MDIWYNIQKNIYIVPVQTLIKLNDKKLVFDIVDNVDIHRT